MPIFRVRGCCVQLLDARARAMRMMVFLLDLFACVCSSSSTTHTGVGPPGCCLNFYLDKSSCRFTPQEGRPKHPNQRSSLQGIRRECPLLVYCRVVPGVFYQQPYSSTRIPENTICTYTPESTICTAVPRYSRGTIPCRPGTRARVPVFFIR